ncbi:MAG TPA: hypothetical protein VHM70_14820 [Polyangiaceae bacterium]|jgi:hypothetical protein|nr:hypothetical protein [Polyangiaceae bacterium]
MIEAGFPLLGTAFVVLIVLPAFALSAKLALLGIERTRFIGPLAALNLRYVLLMGSSALPLAWFVSAGLHQAESGSPLACLFDHHTAAKCFEPGFFAAALALAIALLSLRVVLGRREAVESDCAAARVLAARLERLVARRPNLEGLRGRLLVTGAERFAIGTQGLLKPRVLVGVHFAARLSDEMLAAALGHEQEHVHALDPLRYLILRIALEVNPIGRLLLAPHVARWHAAREAHCDREAVIQGALPLPLADAIVLAARPQRCEPVALGARDTAVLEFRVGLLLAFAEKRPTRTGHDGRSAMPLSVILVSLALFLPHRAGTGALDSLHTGAERALTFFFLH